MPHLSPQTLTNTEQKAILRATARNPRDHLIYSLALGTGLRLAEIVGLNVGDVYTTDGKSKNRVRLRPEIAKNGRAGDVFLPDALVSVSLHPIVGHLFSGWGASGFRSIGSQAFAPIGSQSFSPDREPPVPGSCRLSLSWVPLAPHSGGGTLGWKESRRVGHP